MKTIVVGYDDTDPSRRALERAADLAQAFSSTLIVTSVAPVVVPMPRGAGAIDPTDSPQEHVAELAQAREYLQGRGIQAEFQPAVGEPAETIVDLAEQRQATLIVVGTREPSLLERVLGQSVSAGVARRAHCDVLIVH